jgi:hypothetical protein
MLPDPWGGRPWLKVYRQVSWFPIMDVLEDDSREAARRQIAPTVLRLMMERVDTPVTHRNMAIRYGLAREAIRCLGAIIETRKGV